MREASAWSSATSQFRAAPFPGGSGSFRSCTTAPWRRAIAAVASAQLSATTWTVKRSVGYPRRTRFATVRPIVFSSLCAGTSTAKSVTSGPEAARATARLGRRVTTTRKPRYNEGRVTSKPTAAAASAPSAVTSTGQRPVAAASRQERELDRYLSAGGEARVGRVGHGDALARRGDEGDREVVGPGVARSEGVVGGQCREEVAACELHRAAVTGGHVAVAVLGRHGDVEGLVGGGRRRRAQGQAGRGARLHGDADRAGDAGGRRVGRGDRLRAGLCQRHRERALTVGQRRVCREHHARGGVAAGEVRAAGVRGVGVPVLVLGLEG